MSTHLFGSPASAQPPRGTEAVLVLEAPSEAGWKEGVQALVAELLTNGYELRVRAARSHSLELLEQELRQQVEESGAAAGVSVSRDGKSATTILCRHEAASCERLDADISEGELSRSRLALAVVERLRPLDLSPPPSPPQAPAPKPAPPRAKPPKAPERPSEPARSSRVWLGGGALFSSGASAPLSWLGASVGLAASKRWGFELGVGGSPLPGRAETDAGTLSLSGVQAIGLATFEPWSGPSLGFTLGLGGGALRLQETATPAAGFDGFSRHATVGVLSARARLFHRFGRLYWGLSVDPGVLVPSVKVSAGTQTLLQLGRPWVLVQTSAGFEL